MPKISLIAAPGYDLVCRGDFDLLSRLHHTFTNTVTSKVMSWVPGRGKVFVDQEETVHLGRFDKYSGDLRFGRGTFFYIIQQLMHIRAAGIDLDFSIDPVLREPSRLTLLPKWEDEILRQTKEQPQVTFAKTLLKMKGGIVQAPTGVGKTEIFLSTIESYLAVYPENNVIVTVPKKLIQAEVELRLKKYGLDKDPRVRVIQSTGFIASNRRHEDEWKSWLPKVGMMITDEAHHMRANTYNELLKLLPNVEYSYGFSATPDEKDLTQHAQYYTWSYDAQVIIDRTGPCTVRSVARDLGRTLKYLKVEGSFGTEYNSANFFAHVSAQSKDPRFRDLLITKLRLHRDKTFFLPLPFKEIGYDLAKFLTSNGLPTAIMNGDGFYPEHIKTLEQFKEELSTKKFRCLIATTSGNEGVSIDGMDAVFLVCNREHKVAIQTTGRSYRDSTPPLVINVFNRQSGVLLSQARARETELKKHYDFKVEKEISRGE